MSDDASRPSFDLPPTSVAPRGGRRRPDPALLGALVVGVALVVAIAKPWDRVGPSETPAPVARASVTPSAAAPSVAPTTLDADPTTVAALLDRLDDHRDWGVRVITMGAVGGASRTVRPIESWQPAEPSSIDGVVPLLVTDEPGIVAIGLTAPLDQTPLDVRVWGRGHDGVWHWLDVGRFASDRPSAELLLPPPTVDGTTLAVWPPGRYRFDLLMAVDHVERIDLTVDPATPALDAPVSRPIRTDADRDRVWPAMMPVGSFAVTANMVVPLPGGSGQPASDASAWLLDRAPSLLVPAVTTLGVRLPPGATGIQGTLRRIEPEPLVVAPTATVGARHTPGDPQQVYVEFGPVEGPRFDPGVYAIDAVWTGPDGATRMGTWQVRILPGDPPPPTPLKRAAQRFALAAGTPSLLLEGGTGNLRTLALAKSIGCGLELIDETPPVLGLGHDVADAPSDVSATVLSRDGVDERVPVRLAPSVVPGLSLIAPAANTAFPAGVYTFTIEGFTSREIRVCIGTSPWSG